MPPGGDGCRAETAGGDGCHPRVALELGRRVLRETGRRVRPGDGCHPRVALELADEGAWQSRCEFWGSMLFCGSVARQAIARANGSVPVPAAAAPL